MTNVDLVALCTNRAVLHNLAKKLAGYGLDDTPCRPAWSAYTDNPAGDAAFTGAVRIWSAYATVMLLRQDLLTADDLERFHAEGVARCDLCGRSDPHDHNPDEYGTFDRDDDNDRSIR